MFPFLSGGTSKYEVVGGGAFLDAGFDFFDILNVGPEFGFIVLPKNNFRELGEDSSPTVMIVPVGLQVGAFFYPFSRLEAGLGIAGGASVSISNNKYHYAPWYRAYGEVFFRFNPNISVGLNASWFDVQNNSWFGNPGAAGLSAGISVKVKVDTKKAAGRVDGEVQQDESVFPLLYTIYKENPFGTITIENNETAEIRNVSVRFRAENYTASDIECGFIKQIRKHHKAELSLYADFTDAILQFSEAGKVAGELVISYDLLGKKRVAISQVTIPVYNRNQVRWMDPAVIASYISTSSQEVLEFSKYLVGIARGHLRSGLNRNMQFAMYVDEGIRLAGIQCVTDASTPYSSTHLDAESLDYIQYPYQTIAYKTGDKDDVGILMMAMLESVGIPAAFIPLEDDFIVCFNLGVNASRAASLFDGYDRILIVNDEIWIPLSMSALNEGFINSWYKAVLKIQEKSQAEEDFDFILLSDAWQYYPPAGFSSNEASSAMPAEANLTKSVENDIARYITAEFGPQIAAVQNKIKAEGASVTLYNQLGMLYVRAGMYSSAIPVYEQSAKMGSVPAMNNLGNIASLQKKYKEAKYWYELALQTDPENKSAQKNLERILSELEK
ncbi:MAG: tetratricopeptide repeat protein [Treponema sp.]|nr:tetratricopeptide repeat protein [Treponema sp.]